MLNQGTCVSSQRLCLWAQHRLKLNNWLPAPAIDQSGVACKDARQPGRHARAGQIRMAAAMQRWQSTVIENRTQKKADRYVMSTKQQLLSSCQHQIDAKDQDLRRVLNIFAFHVLNEVKGFLVRIQTQNLHHYAKKKALVSR